ncbi:MAG: hypothetical protein PHT26_16040 [Lentimicrobiaceae bacterium]|nr:hypothetical protein [Lentimicrobiaceae bacterium]
MGSPKSYSYSSNTKSLIFIILNKYENHYFSNFVTVSYITGQAQIILTSQLVDSILNFTAVKAIELKLPALEIIKFTQNPKRQNVLIASQTYLTTRKDIPKEAYIYSNNGYIVFLVFNNVNMDSDLYGLLIKNTESRYSAILDSIKFRPYNSTGLVPLRLTLDVIKIRRCWFNNFYYTLRFTKIFPASKAPKELFPVEKITDGGYMPDPPDRFIYNNKGEILEYYSKQLIPKKPVKIKIKKK